MFTKTLSFKFENQYDIGSVLNLKKDHLTKTFIFNISLFLICVILPKIYDNGLPVGSL